MIRLKCQTCGKKLRADDSALGKTVLCSRCRCPILLEGKPRKIRESSEGIHTLVWCCFGAAIIVAVCLPAFLIWDSTIHTVKSWAPEKRPADTTQEAVHQDAVSDRSVERLSLNPEDAFKNNEAEGQLQGDLEMTLAVPEVLNASKGEGPYNESEDTDLESKSLEQIIADVDPSVVTINVTKKDGSGTGSGFVIDEVGTVATNYHVIEGAQTIEIVFRDENTAPAMGWTAISPGRDLALVRTFFPKKRPRALPLATRELRRGETVITLGSPLGLQGSVSSGIVSAVRTEGDGQAHFEVGTRMIQTTAPLSPGNSGGPLVDLKGEVVGINTMGLMRGENLNFAVAVRHLVELIDSSDGKFHAWSDLPAPRVDPEVLAAQLREAEKRKREEERHERIVKNIGDIGLSIKAAQTDAAREHRDQQELNRINARMITVKNELRVVESEGARLTQERGRVFAEAEAVELQGRRVSQQIINTQNELADRRWRLSLATYNKLWDLVALRKQQIRDLEASLRHLTSEYRLSESNYQGLDREASSLLGLIEYKESEVYRLNQGIADLYREYNAIRGVPPPEELFPAR